jgi:hypothetical protein
MRIFILSDEGGLVQNSGFIVSFKTIFSMDNSLAHDVVPFVDQFLPVVTNPLLAV